MSQDNNKENWGDFSDQTFEFKEEFWEEAEQLLQKDRKETKFKRVSVVLSLLLFLSLWTWWVSDHQMIIDSQEELDLVHHGLFIDTSDQLRPEKYRLEEYEKFKNYPLNNNQVQSNQKSLDNKLNTLTSQQPKTKTNNPSLSIKPRDLMVANEISNNIKPINARVSNENIVELEMMTIVNPLMVKNNIDLPSLSSIEIPEPIKEKLPVVKRSRWSVGFQSGINTLTQASVAPLTQNFGGDIQFKLVNRKRISFDVGIGIKSIQLHDLDTNFTNKTYDFGSQNRITDVSYNKNIYAYLPLKLNLHLKKHQFSAVGSVGYSLATETHLTTRKIEQKSTSLMQSVPKNYGIKEGIQPLLIELGLQYHYSLSNQFDIGAEVFFGANDISQNSFWGTEKSQRSISGNILLRYHFKSFN